MRARPLARMLCLRQVDIHSFFREICKKPDYLIIRTINLKWEHNHWHGSSAFSPYHPHLPLLLQRVSLAMTFTSPLSHFYFHTFTSTHSLSHFHFHSPHPHLPLLLQRVSLAITIKPKYLKVEFEK